MIIEILFSEACNLHGDGQNITYLQASLPQAEFIFTPLSQEPYFSKNKPDMIYLGAMSESIQRRVIEKLLPLKTRIAELVDAGVVFLATGNAGEIFCSKINYVTEGITTYALNFFDLQVTTDLFKRFNGKIVGTFRDMEIVGFKSQFSMIYGDNSACYFFKVDRGIGINQQSNLEGMQMNNLICTHIIGPILPLNPLFCSYLFQKMGVDQQPAFYDAAMDAYKQRLAEFRDPSVVFGNNV